MRFILLFIFAIVTVSRDAHAYDEDFSRIISYSQLMSLSPEKRAEYVKNVREALVELEEMQKLNGAAMKGRYALMERSNFFLQMMVEDANAESMRGWGPYGAAPQTAARPPKLPPYPFKNGLEGFDIFCPAGIRANLRNQILVHGGHKLGCINKGTACPVGWHDFGSNDTKRFCQKFGPTSFAQAKAKYEADLAAKSRADAEKARQRIAKLDADRRAKLAAQQARYRAGARRLSSVVSGLPSDRTPVTGGDTSVENPAGGDVANSGDADAGETSDQQTLTGLTAEAHNDNVLNSMSPDLELDKTNAMGVDLLLANPEANNKKDGCTDTPTPQAPASCKPDTIEAARKKYYQESEPHCMYGGNLRHYANNEKRPGQCQRPTEFCISNYACNKPDGTPIREGDGKDFSCTQEQKNKKYFMCNPLVFNLGADKKPICLPQSKDATVKCNEAAEAIESKIPAGQKVVPFIARVSLKGAADRQQSLDGIADAWNDYATNINKVCFKKPSMDLYCAECAVLKYRVAKMNLLAFNKGGTGNQAHACYTLKLFDRPGISNSVAIPGGAPVDRAQ